MMDASTAYHRVKFQAHPNSELGKVGGPLVDRIDELEADLAGLRNEDVRGRMEEMQRENARLIAELVQLRTAIADSLSLSQDLTSKLTEAHRDAEFGGE